MKRFAMLDTKNNAGIIKSLGTNCHIVAVTGRPTFTKIDSRTRSLLFEIVERNVRRRKIRFPSLFNFAPVFYSYQAISRLKSLFIYQHFYRALSASNADTVLIFNGYLAPNAIFDLVSQSLNIPVIYIENGFFPNTLQADRKGINALSTLPRDAAFYDALNDDDTGQNWPADLVERSSKLKEDTSKNENDKLPKSYIFVPFQVPSDMQILALSPWIADMKHLYNEVLGLAKKFEDLHFVIKEHPSFPLSIQGSVEKHPRIHFRNHRITRELIEGSDAVLTVNSTVGLEALTLGKKVITLGNAHYAIDGLALKVGNREELCDAIKKLPEWTPDNKRREKFIRFVFNRFLLSTSVKSPKENIAELLAARVEATDEYSKLI